MTQQEIEAWQLQQDFEAAAVVFEFEVRQSDNLRGFHAYSVTPITVWKNDGGSLLEVVARDSGPCLPEPLVPSRKYIVFGQRAQFSYKSSTMAVLIPTHVDVASDNAASILRKSKLIVPVNAVSNQ